MNLAAPRHDDPSLESVITLVEAGFPLRVIQESGLGPLASPYSLDPASELLVDVARVSGAPVYEALSRVRDIRRDQATADDEVLTSLAGPRLARRTVLVMPIVAVALGVVLGFDPVSVLFFTPLGWGSLLVGGAFVWWGNRWMARLETRARMHPPFVGLAGEAVALALSAGLPADVACTLVSSAVRARSAVRGHVDVTATRALIVHTRTLGIPASDALRRHAATERRLAHHDRLRSARELGEKILVPMGACFLPAFLLWSVVPAAYGMFRGIAF